MTRSTNLAELVTPPMPDNQRHARFSEFLAKTQSQMLGYILALVMNRDDAEDLFQTSALVMWQKFDEFDESTSFLSWGCRIAYYEACNFLRKKRPQNSPNFLALMDAFASETEVDDDDEERRSALVDCVHSLKPKDRSLLDMVYADNLAVADVAAQLNRPPGGVSNTLLRIRRFLLECVERKLRREDSL